MTLIWHGQSCFKIIGKEVSLVIDPFDPKATGLKNIRPKADVVLITHKQHDDHNNIDLVKDHRLVVETPGEYDVSGTMIKGIHSFHDNKQGKEFGSNIIYIIEIEGVRIAHMGDLGQKELTETQVRQLEKIDILLIPVGGNSTIDGKTASTIVNEIEPSIVIPMHFKVPGLKMKMDGVESFAKEMGTKPDAEDCKFTIKKKDISEEDIKVVILKPE